MRPELHQSGKALGGRWLSWLRNSFLFIAIFSYVLMCLSVAIQMIGRYTLDYPIAQFAEIATYAQVWLATMGAGYALRTGTLFAMDSLVAPLNLSLRRTVLLLNTALAIVFLGVIFYGSIFLLKIGTFQTSPSLGIPMWLIYLALPLSMTYLAIESLVALVERWNSPFAQSADAMELE